MNAGARLGRGGLVGAESTDLPSLRVRLCVLGVGALLWILTSASLALSAPMPYFTSPHADDFLSGVGNRPVIESGTTVLWAVDLTDSGLVTQTTFEYWDGLQWQLIGTDTDPNEEPSDGVVWYPEPGGGGTGGFGWRIVWDESALPEGSYQLRAVMTDSNSEVGTATTTVFIDRTPPWCSFVVPHFEQVVSGVQWLRFAAPPADAVQLECAAMSASKVPDLKSSKDPDAFWHEGCLDIQQSEVTDDENPTGDGSCAPTAGTNALERFLPTADRDAAIERAKKLLAKMETTDAHGTAEDNIANAIIDLLKELAGPGKEPTLTVTTSTAPPTWKDIEDALVAGKSIVLVLEPARGVLGPGARQHAVTVEGKEVDALPGSGGKTHKLVIYDPETGERVPALWGSTEAGEVLGFPVDKNGGILPGETRSRKTSSAVYIAPKKNSPPPGSDVIGTDTNGGDGWAIPWDTRVLPDGYYVLWAEFTDGDGNKAAADEVVLVSNNAAPVTNTPASSDWSIALLALAGVGLGSLALRRKRVAGLK